MSGAGSDLDLAEPPAVVALLMNRGDALARAVGATFLDLIARGVLRRVPGSNNEPSLSVGVMGETELLPYERQVYEHVASRVVPGGDVPQGALCLESEEHEEQWLKAFSDQVARDARERGLLTERTTLSAIIALSRTGPTDFGKRRVMTYEAVRDHLAGGRPDSLDGLETRTPSRLTAYALALGVPARTVKSPFARQEGKVVWSKATGSWKQIRVVDLPWLAGSHPIAAVYALPGALLFFGIWFELLSAYAIKWHLIPTLALPVAWLLWLLSASVVGRFIYGGLYDLTHGSRAVIGQVVFFASQNASDTETPGKEYRIAIDDGHMREATKFEVDADLFMSLRYGNWLRLELTPKLRHVRSAQLIPGVVSPAAPGP